MRALVIGGTGPTGPVIVNGLLDRGYEVSVLHRGEHEIDFNAPVEHIHVDPHFLEELAAALQGRHYEIIIATYGRLRFLVDAAANVTDRLITVGGTMYSFDRSTPADESAPRRVENPLVEKIVRTEQILFDAHERGVFNVTHFRYPGLYGPRQLAPREWSVIRRILDGNFSIPIADGGLTLQSRAYSENAGYATLLAVDDANTSSGQVYNVADLYTPSDADRAFAIARVMGKEIELINYPAEASRPAYFWGVSRDYNYFLTGDPPSTHHQLLDTSKIQSELAYRDLVSFDAAIQRTVNWYIANPFERGGAEEARVGDLFDYEAEMKYRQKLLTFRQGAEEVGYPDLFYKHMYDHPHRPQQVEQARGDV
jgi:nucleoside-diphosphate-sugar epimerase